MSARHRAGEGGSYWPECCAAPGRNLSSLVAGFADCERLGGVAFDAGQRRQLALLLQWATDRVPWYEVCRAQVERLTAGIARPEAFWSAWRALPVLTKAELRQHAAQLDAPHIPPSHHPAMKAATSGSTGTPIELHTTQMTRLVWEALSIREHLWQQRDFRKRLGVVRFQPSIAGEARGMRLPSWGVPVEKLYSSGPAALIHIGQPIAAIADWLIEFDPHYLLASPTVVSALLERMPARPASLEEIRFAFEPVPAELESRLAASWGVRSTELYSAGEVGHIAFRCREHGRLHVQSESVLVELLDDRGRPSMPGSLGRVVVTALHNFATPLVRYDLADYARLGDACPCGRASPVISEVRGRVRNLARRPDGTVYWPVTLKKVGAIAAVRQFQYVQTAIDTIELRLVLARPLLAGEQSRLREIAQQALGYPYRIELASVPALNPGPGGKFEEFLSLI